MNVFLVCVMFLLLKSIISSQDSKPHDYFLHSFGEEFLNTAIADKIYKNLYHERKITSNGNLGSSS